jgi:hypothetical protein
MRLGTIAVRVSNGKMRWLFLLLRQEMFLATVTEELHPKGTSDNSFLMLRT